MNDYSKIWAVAGAALLGAVLVTLSVAFIDRPVERLVADHVLNYNSRLMFFDGLASPSLLAFPLACSYLLFYAVFRLWRRPAGQGTELLLKLSIAVAVVTLAKDELKWLIGRPWPFSWLEEGMYRLHPFTNDAWYGSFPSGHTSVSAAPMFVLWWCLPKYRPLWLVVVFSVMIGLVGSGHHYVGDVIGGFFLGLGVAAGVVTIWPDMPDSAKQEGLPFGKKKPWRQQKQKDLVNAGR